MVSSLKVLFSSIVDYAGLFPPAQLSMEEALNNYIQYKSGPFAWMLGAFLLPVSRHHEFQHYTQKIRPDTHQIFRWPIHLIFPKAFDKNYDLEQLKSEDIELTTEGNQAHRYRVKALEFPALSLKHLETVLQSLPKDKDIYFEVPLNQDIGKHLIRIKSAGHCAKVRLGGLTPDAFPSSKSLSHFLMSVAQINLPFKATAGLHYLLPGTHPLNARDTSLKAKMHGFLNLAVTSAMMSDGSMTIHSLINLLEQHSLHAFQFDEAGVSVRDQSQSGEQSIVYFTLMELLQARRYGFRSFGSCSFEQPVMELQEVLRC